MKILRPVYVGFGMLTPVTIMVVEQLPAHNTGALVKEVSEFVFDDAAIIACLLRQWEMPTAMIGTAVGDDIRGHILAQQLEAKQMLFWEADYIDDRPQAAELKAAMSQHARW